MDEEQARLREQIERCRRLASLIVEDDLRHSLEDLAEEYEERLASRRKRFMLREDVDRD